MAVTARLRKHTNAEELSHLDQQLAVASPPFAGECLHDSMANPLVNFIFSSESRLL